jgi:prophage antirepressor-like protein
MNTIVSYSTFIFSESELIRIILINQEPWFIAKDICNSLGYITNQQRESALRKLENDEKLSLKISDSGQNREMIAVNESGLYALILKSTKPQAKVFRKWVTAEVLPQIRKTGSYQSNQQAPKSWDDILTELDQRYVLAQEMDDFALPLVQYIQSLEQRIKHLEKNQPSEASNYVYVFHNRQTDEYKIGKSGDVALRQKTLQLVEPNIYLYLKIPMQSARHANLWERTLQSEFESKRVHGEWFKLKDSDLAVLRLLAKVVAISAENI